MTNIEIDNLKSTADNGCIIADIIRIIGTLGALLLIAAAKLDK